MILMAYESCSTCHTTKLPNHILEELLLTKRVGKGFQLDGCMVPLKKLKTQFSIYNGIYIFRARVNWNKSEPS